MPLSMKIIHKPNASVGQVVKDLEQIVAKNPAVFIDYSNVDGNDMYVEGIKLRKDIAILETTGRKKRAATAEDLLAMFRVLDASLGVVIQEGWEMLNLEPNKDGSIFKYDDEEDYCLFTMDRDVRLLTTQQIEKELEERGLEKVLNYKVAAASKSKKMAYHVNCLARHYGKLCLYYDKDKKEQSITVGELLEEFPTCAEFMMMFGGRYFTVDVGEKGIFFPFQNEEGKHLGLYIGEMVYDPNEIWD